MRPLLMLPLVVALCHLPSPAAQAEPPPTPADPVTLQVLAAQQGPATEISVADVQSLIAGAGSGGVVLHLWASWCPPCLRDLPFMGDLNRELAARGTRLISVSVDEPGENVRHKVGQLIDSRAKGALTRAIVRVPNPQAFVRGLDPRWKGSIPALFVFGPGGRLLGTLVGEAPPHEIRRVLDRVLPSPALRADQDDAQAPRRPTRSSGADDPGPLHTSG